MTRDEAIEAFLTADDKRAAAEHLRTQGIASVDVRTDVGHEPIANGPTEGLSYLKARCYDFLDSNGQIIATVIEAPDGTRANVDRSPANFGGTVIHRTRLE